MFYGTFTITANLVALSEQSMVWVQKYSPSTRSISGMRGDPPDATEYHLMFEPVSVVRSEIVAGSTNACGVVAVGAHGVGSMVAVILNLVVLSQLLIV
jgi:hypothetical protein